MAERGQGAAALTLLSGPRRRSVVLCSAAPHFRPQGVPGTLSWWESHGATRTTTRKPMLLLRLFGLFLLR
jgi:hypothetical protein